MKKGFTIIELIVSMGIFSMLIPILFLVFFSTLTLYAQTSALQRIKNQGDYMRTTITNKIRNTATGVVVDCELIISEMGNTPCFQSATGNIYFGYETDANGYVYYYENSNYPTVNSATITSMLLDASNDTDFPLKARTAGNLVSYIEPANNNTVIFDFTIDYLPRTNVSTAQSLQYTFYVTLR